MFLLTDESGAIFQYVSNVKNVSTTAAMFWEKKNRDMLLSRLLRGECQKNEAMVLRCAIGLILGFSGISGRSNSL
jgi:hypothetical protein